MLIITILAILAIVADQVSKVMIVHYFAASPLQDIPVINGVLHFTYVENTGAAFGMLKDARWLFIIVTIIFSIALLIWLIRLPKLHWLLKISSGLILGGAVGNLIDRIGLAYVRDFIDFRFLKHFAIFNVADSCVVVGTILFAFYLLFIHEKFLPALKKDHNVSAS